MRKTRSNCWGLVAEGALEKQRFQSIVLYSRAEASRAVTFHVPRFARLASLFFRRPLPPSQRARNRCMHAHIKRPSPSSSHNLHLLHAIHCALIVSCITTAGQSHFSLVQRRWTAICGYHVRALALERCTLTSHTPRKGPHTPDTNWLTGYPAFSSTLREHAVVSHRGSLRPFSATPARASLAPYANIGSRSRKSLENASSRDMCRYL